jgi:acyl-CoA hydrolase
MEGADCWTAGVHHNDFQAKFCSKPTLHDTPEPMMKLFLAHTMVFVGSIWTNKGGWFLFVMSSLGLSVATEIVLTAGLLGSIITMIFKPSFAQNQPCMTPQSQ